MPPKGFSRHPNSALAMWFSTPTEGGVASAVQPAASAQVRYLQSALCLLSFAVIAAFLTSHDHSSNPIFERMDAELDHLFAANVGLTSHNYLNYKYSL